MITHAFFLWSIRGTALVLSLCLISSCLKPVEAIRSNVHSEVWDCSWINRVALLRLSIHCSDSWTAWDIIQ